MKAPEDVPQLLTVTQFADMTQVTERQVRHWIASGKLTVIRLGRRSVRVTPEDAARFLYDRREETKP